MASNAYHFEDHWQVPFPIEQVWEILARPEDYPRWWRGVYLSATRLDAEGKRVAVVARGFLPYKLRFTIESLKHEKPTLIEFRASGDFVTDISRWIIRPDGNGSAVILEWNPRVEKPIVKFLSPVLKPIFYWNHEWTMRRGERQIAEYLSGRATSSISGEQET
jgi:Polyketide cyclase / dehydrase and lipid transport